MAKSTKRHDLQKLSIDAIDDAFKFQQKEEIWNFYSEREFLENMLNQRVNFVIAVFALVITAAFQVDKLSKASLLFGVGSIFLLLLYLSAKRIHARLDIVLKILYKIDKRHVFPVVKKELEAKSFWNHFGQQTNNTYVQLPFFCMIILFLGFVIGCILLFTPSSAFLNWFDNLH